MDWLRVRYRFWLPSFLALALAVAGMATAGPSMAAPVTYTYQGPNFTSATGVYDTSMSISGFITFDPALGANIDIFLCRGIPYFRILALPMA